MKGRKSNYGDDRDGGFDFCGYSKKWTRKGNKENRSVESRKLNRKFYGGDSLGKETEMKSKRQIREFTSVDPNQVVKDTPERLKEERDEVRLNGLITKT